MFQILSNKLYWHNLLLLIKANDLIFEHNDMNGFEKQEFNYVISTKGIKEEGGFYWETMDCYVGLFPISIVNLGEVSTLMWYNFLGYIMQLIKMSWTPFTPYIQITSLVTCRPPEWVKVYIFWQVFLYFYI